MLESNHDGLAAEVCLVVLSHIGISELSDLAKWIILVWLLALPRDVLTFHHKHLWFLSEGLILIESIRSFLHLLLIVLILSFDLLVKQSGGLIRQVKDALDLTLRIVCLMIANQFLSWDRVDLESLVPIKGEESECE